MKLPILRYECDNCGLCCTSTLIMATDIDVQREPKLRACKRMVDHDGKPTNNYLMNLPPDDPKGGCRFHDGKQCTIYPTRPHVCVGFQAGGEDCQYLRRSAGLPELVAVPDEIEQEFVYVEAECIPKPT